MSIAHALTFTASKCSSGNNGRGNKSIIVPSWRPLFTNGISQNKVIDSKLRSDTWKFVARFGNKITFSLPCFNTNKRNNKYKAAIATIIAITTLRML